MSKCCRTFHYQKKFRLILIYWILELVCRIFMYICWDFFQLTDDDANDEYIYLMISVLSDFFSLVEYIPYLKKKLECIFPKNIEIQEEKEVKLKESQDKEEEKNKIDNNNTQKIEYDNKYNKYIWILYLIPIGDLLSKSIFFTSYKIVDLKDEVLIQKLARDGVIIIDTIFRTIFCYIFNNQKTYSESHKKCSLIFMIIFLSILVVLDIFHLNLGGNYQLNNLLFFLLCLSVRSITYFIIF